MASPVHQLHFLLVPLMSQSHLIPFMDMAKLLANRGIIVTIVLTPLNALRFNKILPHSKASDLQIQFLSMPFPCQEFGLPEGCENLDTLPSLDLSAKFFEATSALQDPLEKWLEEESQPRPNCLIADYCLPWTVSVADKFNIPRVIFHTISCFTLVCSDKLAHSDTVDNVMSDTEPFLVPNIPHRIEFTLAQLPGAPSRKKSSNPSFKEAEKTAQGVLVNSFQELETEYVREYQKIVKKVWCIGPVSLSKQGILPDNISGNENTDDGKDYCLKWLDSKKPKSVIYACFGSLCSMLASQLKELALGLESSNRPFIWVIRKGDYSTELKEWLVEENFEERVRGRGLIVRGWAPQVPILSHPSTGGFLTHCGWNSTLEGVSAGLPMITWPMFAEQFVNEKLIVEILKTGVGVGVEKISTHLQKEDKLVTREDITRAIDKLMDEGEEGEERRKRARKVGEMAKSAVEEGGSSYLNMTLFIQHVIEQVMSQLSSAADIIVSREAMDSMHFDIMPALNVVSN